MRLAFRNLVVLLILAGVAASCLASTREPDGKPANPPAKPGTTIPMKAETNVVDCIAVEAGLLPERPASQLFGGWVAKSFATVRVNISNRCPDQQFILHDIYFDYSGWALSGLLQSQQPEMAKVKAAASQTDEESKADSTTSPAFPQDTQRTRPAQIASIGSKEIHDASKQMGYFSPRNLVVNGLVLVGTAASGYSFLVSSDVAKGIAAYGNDFVPGLAKFWQDRGPDQQAQILLYGFQNNKVVAKQSSDFVYAFFPIDRFLTPGLRKLFLKSPAAFFNPSEMFFDPNQKLFEPATAPILALTGKKDRIDFLRAANSDCTISPSERDPRKACSDDEKQVKATLDSLSLNTVHVIVRGIMTIDVNAVPPTIDGITCENEKEAATWTVAKPEAGKKATPKEVKCTITGKFLTDAVPSITAFEAPKKDLSREEVIVGKSLKVDTEKATATSLPFSFEIQESVPSGSQITFEVTRKTKAESDSSAAPKSNPVQYKVDYGDTAATPKVTDLKIDNDDTAWEKAGTINGTITGTDLSGTTTITVPDLKIDGKSATPAEYIDNCADNAKKSTATSVRFDCDLKQKIASPATVTFRIVLESGGKDHTFDKEHTVPEQKTAAKPAPAKKNAAAKTSAPKKQPEKPAKPDAGKKKPAK